MLALSVTPVGHEVGGDFLEPLKLLDDAQPPRRGQLADDLVLAALIVGRRSPAARRRGLQVDPLEIAVKRQD